jgi:hypothetical protein
LKYPQNFIFKSFRVAVLLLPRNLLNKTKILHKRIVFKGATANSVEHLRLFLRPES